MSRQNVGRRSCPVVRHLISDQLFVLHEPSFAAPLSDHDPAYRSFSERKYAKSVADSEGAFQRASVMLALSTIPLSILLVATLGWRTSSASAQRVVSIPSLERSRAIPKLVPAPSQLRDECVLAATRLRFPVPCPHLVPSLTGRPMSCPRPVGAASGFPPCVGVEGAAPYSIFFLQFYGFDVPKGYSGINGKPVGHLTLEAHGITDDPLLTPCIGGRITGTARIGIWTTREFTCPTDSPSIERDAVHGEGAYVGHLALA